MKNSRGLIPSKKHIQDRNKDLEYLQEMTQFHEKRGGRIWDDELRDEYNQILLKYNVISLETLPEQLRPTKED